MRLRGGAFASRIFLLRPQSREPGCEPYSRLKSDTIFSGLHG